MGIEGDNIDEGCAYVEHGGYGYFAHSASSFMNDNYCVGLSVVDLSTDVMDETNWKKSTTPIMSRSDENSSYGPGSPLFVKSPDGTEDWIIYHGGPIGGQTATDRRVRAQIINWTDEGEINLGIPSNPDAVLDAPSGEMKTDVYEAEDGTCSSVTKHMFNNTAKASGSGYVKYDVGSGYVLFDVDAAEAGDYILNLRYNNLGEAMTADVTVNGADGYTAHFKKNGKYAVDLDTSKVYNVHLDEGQNTIKVAVETPCEFALDAMVITKGHMYDASGVVNVSVNVPATGSYQVLFEGTDGKIIRNLNLTKGQTVINNPNGKYDKVTVCEALTSTYEVFGSEVNVKVESEGIYDVTFITADGSTTKTIKLNKGENTIAVLDGTTKVHLYRRTPWHYQAENGEMSGVSAQSDHLYYNGTGFDGGFDNAGSSVSVVTSVAYSGTHTLSIRYSGTGEQKSLSLYINGQKVKQLSGEGTADWDSWKEIDEEVYLRAGKNTVELRRDGDDTGVINIDEIVVDKYSMGEPTVTVNKLIAGEVYAIKDKNSGLSADIDGYSPDAGKEIHLWHYLGNNNQKWKMVDLGNGYWAFKGTYGSKRFSINENLTAMTADENNNDDAQQWKLEKVGNYYKMINKKYEKVLTVDGASKAAGARLTVADDEELDNQLFSIDGGLPSDTTEVREIQNPQNPDDYAAYGSQYELAEPKIPEPYDPYVEIENGKYRRYDAVNGLLENGASVETNHQGYYGDGFVGGMFNGDAAVTFRINVDVAGIYKVRLGYCNGFGQEQVKAAATYVNGEYVSATELPSTGGWDDWGTVEFTLQFNEGVNKVTFKNNAETAGYSGDVNYDYLDISKYPVNVTADESSYESKADGCIKRFELENCELESGANLATDHHDYSGNGFVGGMYNGSAKIVCNVNVPKTDTYKMRLRYCNGHGENVEDKVVAITVNGEYIKGLALPKTGNWDTWNKVEFELELEKGTSAIAFVNSSSLTGYAGDVNYDYLDFFMSEPEVDPDDPDNTGNQGDPNNSGDTGNQGDPNNSGDTGNQGDPNNSGDTGNQGDPNNSGDTGNQGDPNNSGDTGNQGDPNNSGDTGNQGAPNNSGDTGNQGDPNNSGDTGNQGDPNNSGDTGNQGDSNNSGDTGNQGDPNNSGDTGNQGDPNNSGDTGNQGDSNNSGDTENQGDSNNSGDTTNPEDTNNQGNNDSPETVNPPVNSSSENKASSPENPSGQAPTGYAASSNRTISTSDEVIISSVAAVSDKELDKKAKEKEDKKQTTSKVSEKIKDKKDESSKDKTQEVTEDTTDEDVITETPEETTASPEISLNEEQEAEKETSVENEKEKSPVVPIVGGIAAVGAIGVGGYSFMRRRRR